MRFVQTIPYIPLYICSNSLSFYCALTDWDMCTIRYYTCALHGKAPIETHMKAIWFCRVIETHVLPYMVLWWTKHLSGKTDMRRLVSCNGRFFILSLIYIYCVIFCCISSLLDLGEKGFLELCWPFCTPRHHQAAHSCGKDAGGHVESLGRFGVARPITTLVEMKRPVWPLSLDHPHIEARFAPSLREDLPIE